MTVVVEEDRVVHFGDGRDEQIHRPRPSMLRLLRQRGLGYERGRARTLIERELRKARELTPERSCIAR